MNETLRSTVIEDSLNAALEPFLALARMVLECDRDTLGPLADFGVVVNTIARGAKIRFHEELHAGLAHERKVKVAS